MNIIGCCYGHDAPLPLARISCRVCDLVDMTSQDVRDDADVEAGSAGAWRKSVPVNVGNSVENTDATSFMVPAGIDADVMYPRGEDVCCCGGDISGRSCDNHSPISMADWAYGHRHDDLCRVFGGTPDLPTDDEVIALLGGGA